MNNYTLKCSSTVHSHSHNHEREIMLPSFMLVRGIVYIAGKWYGMEPINTSRTLEHRFYHLEDMQHTPFHCGVLNDNLHRQMQIFVKQSVRYAFSPNNTSSKEELLRVNTFFVSLPRATVQTIPSVCPSSWGSAEPCFGMVSLQVGLAEHFLVAHIFMDPKLLGVLINSEREE